MSIKPPGATWKDVAGLAFDTFDLLNFQNKTIFVFFGAVFTTASVMCSRVHARSQQVAHSTCGDSEYNLRSRTVVCSSCGLPSDKPGSHCSVTSASRSSFRSGGISEGLLPQSYVFSASSPRKVSASFKVFGWQLILPLFWNDWCDGDFVDLFSFRLEPEWISVQLCEPAGPSMKHSLFFSLV